MSMFTQIILAAVLAAIFGFWAKIAVKAWENGSGKVKASIVAASVTAFLSIIGLAVYNGWIALPEMDSDTRSRVIKFVIIIALFTATRFVLLSDVLAFAIGRIFRGALATVLSAGTVYAIWIFMVSLLENEICYRIFYSHGDWIGNTLKLLFCSLLLSVLLPFVTTCIFRSDKTAAGLLFASNAVMVGYAFSYVSSFLAVLTPFFFIFISYQIWSLLTNQRSDFSLIGVAWMVEVFVDLFTE